MHAFDRQKIGEISFFPNLDMQFDQVDFYLMPVLQFTYLVSLGHSNMQLAELAAMTE
uniref:Uncharacterized protein n=1 Tax=Arundo donax TaxID=35708 RepID=A0A0A9E8B6_ARUDO